MTNLIVPLLRSCVDSLAWSMLDTPASVLYNMSAYDVQLTDLSPVVCPLTAARGASDRQAAVENSMTVEL